MTLSKEKYGFALFTSRSVYETEYVCLHMSWFIFSYIPDVMVFLFFVIVAYCIPADDKTLRS